MELILVSLIITLGFSFCSYISYIERKKLHLLIKSVDLSEVKHYETAPSIDEQATTLADSIPESLNDIFEGKTPDEIRESFKYGN